MQRAHPLIVVVPGSARARPSDRSPARPVPESRDKVHSDRKNVETTSAERDRPREAAALSRAARTDALSLMPFAPRLLTLPTGGRDDFAGSRSVAGALNTAQGV